VVFHTNGADDGRLFAEQILGQPFRAAEATKGTDDHLVAG